MSPKNNDINKKIVVWLASWLGQRPHDQEVVVLSLAVYWIEKLLQSHLKENGENKGSQIGQITKTK